MCSSTFVDEAHLLRLELLAQLHTLTQLPFDQKTMVPMVLSGQNILIDRLLFHTSRPFASRVVGRTLLEGLTRDQMAAYLAHHLTIVGGNADLLCDDAVTAIHQGSGGLLRRANALARGALLAAATRKESVVTAEHVRLASTEILCPAPQKPGLSPASPSLCVRHCENCWPDSVRRYTSTCARLTVSSLIVSAGFPHQRGTLRVRWAVVL